MIEIQPKIHDRNTIEFKVGYATSGPSAQGRFEMCTWIYIPEALGVNRHTYPKDAFYRDMLSYLRLITPQYTLAELADEHALPYQLLEKACLSVLENPTEQAREEYEREIKMFASIVKSTIRDACKEAKGAPSEVQGGEVRGTKSGGARYEGTRCDLAEGIRQVLKRYRALGKRLDEQQLRPDLRAFYAYGDEFISNVVEQHVFRLLRNSPTPTEANASSQPTNKSRDAACYASTETSSLISLLAEERRYRDERGYLQVEQDSRDRNTAFVYHASQLKKYVESNLYLPTHKRRNAVLLEQMVFSLAAGLSMMFATVVSFAFQQTYGNFTLPFFIALVVSYMFKDRIKELVRNYFSSRLSSRLFDYKIDIRVGALKVGQCKEGFDFLPPEKINPEAKAVRNRHSPLVIGRGVEEQVIQYRKRIHLNRRAVEHLSDYPLRGVNDIVRFNLSEFMRKMDNQHKPLFVNQEPEGFAKVDGQKVYYLNFVIRLRYEQTTTYRRYRIRLTRKGIQGIEER